MSLEKLTGLDKAAILLICMGGEAAARVLEELSDDEVFKVTRAMAEIVHIPNDVKDKVLDEFEYAKEHNAGLVIRGQEFAKRVIAKAGPAERTEQLLDKFASGIETRPLETIASMQPVMVAGLLESEHPQTIALVLSTQSPEHASAIISNLPEELRADVVYRIATTQRVSPEVINRIEEALQREIGVVRGGEQKEVGGIKKVIDILDHMENNLDADILEAMEEKDPDMVEDIRKQMFTFEDLVNLDGRSLQMILREVNNDSLTLALKTASDELKEKIFKNMSKRAADMLRDDLEAKGPVRLSEVEEAQKAILAVAKRLADEGEIALGGSGGDEFV